MTSLPRTTIARDTLFFAATVGLWWLERRSSGSTGASARALQTAAGVSAAVVGFLIHEWGHLAGALLAKSRVHYPNRILAPLLFHFDSASNDKRQFLFMSYGGYLASAVGVALIASLAPLDARSGRLALGLAGLGLVVTFVAEVPITVRVLRGAPLPTGYAYGPPRA